MKPDLSSRQPESKRPLPSLFREVKVTCNGCGSKFRLADRYAGRRLKCRKCGELLEAPNSTTLVERPAGPKPSPLELLATRVRTFLTGDFGQKTFRRVKWTTETQRRRVLALLSALGTVAAISALVLFLRSDTASLLFGTAAGKEIAFKRLVELENELAATLQNSRTAADIPDAVRSITSIRNEQLSLWETIAEWKLDGDLTPGELNLLRTRYRRPFETATAGVAKEQLRIAKDPQLGPKILDALSRNSKDLATTRQLTLSSQQL